MNAPILFGLISFTSFDNRDVDSDRGIEIGVGKHYKIAWQLNTKHPYYWTCRTRICIAIPYICFPNYWFCLRHDQLNFQDDGTLRNSSKEVR